MTSNDVHPNDIPEIMPHEAGVREHTFDGIREFDNRLPNWWLWTLYLTVIFSVGYWIHYHTLGTGALPMAAYHQDSAAMAEARAEEAARNPVTDEVLLEMSKSAGSVSAGEAIFTIHCVQCHQADLSGGLGPNLTDEWFLHGGMPTDIYATVAGGAPNGMQAWEGIIGKTKVMQVVAYVMTQVGSNRPGKAHDADRAKKADLSWKSGN